jgi:hypothetical protein
MGKVTDRHETGHNVIYFSLKNFKEGKVNLPRLKINAKNSIQRNGLDFIFKTKVLC